MGGDTIRYETLLSANLFSILEFENAVDTHQQLLSQLTENQQVLKELGSLEPESQVYKRIGPVLARQDIAEAKVNVQKRIEFIMGESDRVDKLIESLASKRDGLQSVVLKLQQS